MAAGLTYPVAAYSDRFQAGIWGTATVIVTALVLLLLVLSGPAAARYASIVIDVDTGEILHARNEDDRNRPASLTKMMTLYKTFQALREGRLAIDQRLAVSTRAAGQTPSKLGLRVGQRISVSDAILAVVTKSANDAATVLAEAQAESEFHFALEMTETARALGMYRTTFRNATGLPNRRQRSTARDIALLSRALIRDFPEYYAYFSSKTFKWDGRRHENHNNLLAKYEGTDGIKTGYTRASGFNLAASVRRNGRHLVAVVFGGRTAQSRDRHMMGLLDQAFATPRAEGVLIANARWIDPMVPIANPLRSGRRVADVWQAMRIATAKPVAPSAAVDTIRVPPVLPPANPVTVNASKTAIAPPVATRELPDGWGIQVGAFQQPTTAERRIRQAALVAPTYLGSAAKRVEEAEKSGRKLFRARLLGLTESTARAACRHLNRRNFNCVPVTPDEVRLALR